MHMPLVRALLGVGGENSVEDFKLKYWWLGTTRPQKRVTLPKRAKMNATEEDEGEVGEAVLQCNGRAANDAGNQSRQPTASQKQQQQQGLGQEETMSEQLGNLTLERAEIKCFHGAYPALANAPPLVS